MGNLCSRVVFIKCGKEGSEFHKILNTNEEFCKNLIIYFEYFTIDFDDIYY